MVLGAHYLDEDVAKALITIPVAAASLAAYLEGALTLCDGRINIKCNLSANASAGADFDALSGVEYNTFLKLLQNTRLSREGTPAEVAFVDAWFSLEDLVIMEKIADRTFRTIWVEEE